MVAVCVSAVPGSVKVAGASAMVVPASSVRSAPALTAGATLLTVMVAVRSWESCGTPLSVTTKVIGPDAASSTGVQLKCPVEGWTEAPGLGVPSEKVRSLAGMSVSVAVTVKASGLPSATVASATAPITGAWFTSCTVMVRVCSSTPGVSASSVTRTAIS